MKRPAIRAALALLLTVLLCAGANIAAFFIDTQTMRSNAAQGVAMLGEQGGIPQLIGGFKAAQLDNYTSVLILKTAAYTGEETLMQRAFGGTRTDMPTAEGQSAWEAYCTYADGSLSPTGGLTYSRYWHGYTLPLRILLCVMNVSNIQMFLLAVPALPACAGAFAAAAAQTVGAVSRVSGRIPGDDASRAGHLPAIRARLADHAHGVRAFARL